MQEICWFLRYFTRKDELLRASSGFDSLWERQNDGHPVVFSFQGIVLFANRTQLRCRTPKFGLTLGFVSKLTASLFRHFVPYDSLWERQNDGHSVVFSFQGIVLFANRTQLRCRTPKFGLTLGFVCKPIASLFCHFVPYDSLWAGHETVFFITKRAVFLLSITFLPRAVTHCNFCQNMV